MSRRQGAEGFESKKKAAKQAKNEDKRKANIKEERQSIIVACEGTKTECLYLNNIFRSLKAEHEIASDSLVIAKHKHTDPEGVLDDLLSHSNYQDFTHKWIVIDRDIARTNGGGHTLVNFNGALARAKSNQVEVAYSNPCFEIWYLLHLEYRNTAIDRDKLVKKLETKYGYQKNTLFQEGNVNSAIANAKRLLTLYGRPNPAIDNPSTTVHKLFKVLESFKKKPEWNVFKIRSLFNLRYSCVLLDVISNFKSSRF